MGRSGVLQNKSLHNQQELVHNFPSAFRADTNRVWLLLLLNLEWSTLNRRFGDALPQPFAVLRRDLLVKPAPVWVGRGGRLLLCSSMLQWLLFLFYSSLV